MRCSIATAPRMPIFATTKNMAFALGLAVAEQAHAANGLAKALLKQLYPELEIVSWVAQVHDIICPLAPSDISAQVVESNIVRTGDEASAQQMIKAIETARDSGDSVGGVVACTLRGVPVGLGEPVFDKLEASLAHAMMSIPACKGFELGSGFAAACMKGSEHNDSYYMQGKRVRTRSNYSGGVQGGISNGEDINMRLAFKPTATLMLVQDTINDRFEEVKLKGKGRHDACVLPRAVPIVEAMAAITLADFVLRQRAARIQIC